MNILKPAGDLNNTGDQGCMSFIQASPVRRRINAHPRHVKKMKTIQDNEGVRVWSKARGEGYF